MKKIVITGAAGFLGKRIALAYQNRYLVSTPAHREMDITKKESVIKYILENEPDIVIHCAAVSDVGVCEKNPETSWKINVDGSVNIAEVCQKKQIKCILCSSDQVYMGSGKQEPHKETEVLEPVNHYGRQKLQAEKLCQKVNPDSVLLRLSWMYDTKSLSETEHGDFMRTLLQNMKQKQELSFPIYDKRGITDVHLVVENLEKVFELPGGIYNYGSENGYTTYEMMEKLFLALDIKNVNLVKNMDAFQSHPRNLTMSLDKLQKYGIEFPATYEQLHRILKKEV